MKSPILISLGLVLSIFALLGQARAQDPVETGEPHALPRTGRQAAPKITPLTEKDLTPAMLAELAVESNRRAAMAPRVLATAASPEQTGIPLGRYLATVEKTAFLNNQPYMLSGEYQLIFSADNKVRFARNDFGLWSGSYSLVGTRITFTPSNGTYGCTSPGSYTFAVAGNRLSLTPIANVLDRCAGRFYAVSSAAFLKSDAADATNDWKNIGPEGGRVFALLQHEGKLFAGLDWLGGVMVSSDNGQTWQATRGTQGYAIFSLAAHNGVLFAGAHLGQIFLSLDGGANWEQFSGGLFNPPSNIVVLDFVSHNGRLFAATSGDGVWRMVGNDPYQWERAGVTGLTSGNVRTLVSIGNTLFAGTQLGVFASTDNGNTWQLRNTGLTVVSTLALTTDGNKLYASSSTTVAATPNEVSISEDLGLTWTRVGNIAVDLPNQANTISNLIAFGGKLYGAGANGISIFDGTKWTTAYRSPTFIGGMYSILAAGNTLLAGSFADGIARSTDSGATWSNASTGLKRTVNCSYKDQNVLLSGGLDGIMISRNDGQSWTRAPMTAGTAAQTFPTIFEFLSFAGKYYAGASSGVFVSTNQGQSWTRLATGLGAGQAFRVIAVGSTLYATVYNPTSGGLYRSTDEGQTWALAPASLNSRLTEDIAVQGNNFFVATDDRGVMRSTDGGQTWAQANAGLPAGPAYTIHAIGNNTLLVVIFGQGVYRSSDNGQTWTRSHDGVDINELYLFTSGGGTIFVNTNNTHSMMRSTDEGRTWRLLSPPVLGHIGGTVNVNGSTLYYATPTGLYVSDTQVHRTSAVSAASYSPNGITEKTITSAFGEVLANSVQAASSIPLPTTLAGTTVKVTDANGITRAAPLFYVAGAQVNFQVPMGTANGPASLLITNAGGIGSRGEFVVRAAGPGIFSTNGQGQGAAAAFDALTGGGAPFSAAQANGQPNILAVFGTGLGGDVTDGGGNVNTAVTARIGTSAATVLYAGQAPGFVGLNQFNVQLPAGLTAGTHTLTITRGGVTSNSVTIAIR